MFRSLVRYLGDEINSRGVLTIIAIAGPVLAFAAGFLVNKALPVVNPEWSGSSYGEGFRSGRRLTELEQENNSLREQLRLSEAYRKLEQEWSRLTPEQASDRVMKSLKDGTF